MIKKTILIILGFLFLSNITLAGDSCLLSDNLGRVKCERETYLKQNISEIANSYGVSEVLGGTFYVLTIERLNNDQALVNFEDGHILIIAEISFDQKNRITEFNVTYPEDYFTEKYVAEYDSTKNLIEKKEEKISTLKKLFLKIKSFFIGILK